MNDNQNKSTQSTQSRQSRQTHLDNIPNIVKTGLKVYITLTIALTIVGLAIIAITIPLTHNSHSLMNTRALNEDAEGCPLDCGRYGSCQFADKVPYCHCLTSYATFPERVVGFHATCTLDLNNNTICEAPLTDGSHATFVNARGPCSYSRQSQVGVALAAWLGDAVGASWFYMVDTHSNIDNQYIVDINGNRRGLTWNGGYIAGGLFSLFTGAYLGIGWLINGIRCLIVPTGTSIPYWDALGYAPEFTVKAWNRMDDFVAPTRFVAEAVLKIR